MTLKGSKNHFNVKFLKDYGFSINVKDSKIILFGKSLFYTDFFTLFLI